MKQADVVKSIDYHIITLQDKFHIQHTLINLQCKDNSLSFCNILLDPNSFHSILQSEKFVFPFEVSLEFYQQNRP